MQTTFGKLKAAATVRFVNGFTQSYISFVRVPKRRMVDATTAAGAVERIETNTKVEIV